MRVFFDEKVYAFCLQQLKIAAEQSEVALHAFVLVSNHVHLLVWGGDRKSKRIKINGQGVYSLDSCFVFLAATEAEFINTIGL